MAHTARMTRTARMARWLADLADPKKLAHAHHRVPVAQWLEHPNRTRGLCVQISYGALIFSEFLLVFNIMYLLFPF